MNANVITIYQDKEPYLALDIEGMIFKLSTQDYIRLNKGKGINGELCSKFAKIVTELQAVEDLGGINSLFQLDKGFCSYRLTEQCTQG